MSSRSNGLHSTCLLSSRPIIIRLATMPQNRVPPMLGQNGTSPTLAQNGGYRSGRACPLCPGISDINLFRYCQGVIDLDAEIPDCALDLGVPKQELDGSEIAGAAVDQGSLCASERVRPEKSWIQPDAADPVVDKTSVLTSCHVASGSAMICKQELAESLVGDLQIVVHRLTGLLGHTKIESTVRYLGIEVDDVLAIAEQVDV